MINATIHLKSQFTEIFDRPELVRKRSKVFIEGQIKSKGSKKCFMKYRNPK